MRKKIAKKLIEKYESPIRTHGGILESEIEKREERVHQALTTGSNSAGESKSIYVFGLNQLDELTIKPFFIL